MPKKLGIVFVMLGAVLTMLAVLLFMYNIIVEDLAEREAELALRKVQAAVVQEDAQETMKTEEIEDPTMTVVEIDGYGYIGYLGIPSLDLELPVMADWDYTRLKIAPCRQFGSTKTDDLVIAAHNYKRHFGQINTLEDGAEVTFTDMDGEKTVYAVAMNGALSPYAVDAVKYSEYPLVLYTCTYGGGERIAVFCEKKEAEPEEQSVEETQDQAE